MAGGEGGVWSGPARPPGVLKLCALSSRTVPGRGDHRSRACRSRSRILGLKQVSGPGSEGCRWTGAARR